MEIIAVIGAGLVGRAWAIVFARAGHPVMLFDANAAALAPALDAIEASLGDLDAHGLVAAPPRTIRQRITGATSLADALREAGYVQENVFENLDAKKDISPRWTRSRPPRRSWRARPPGSPRPPSPRT